MYLMYPIREFTRYLFRFVYADLYHSIFEALCRRDAAEMARSKGIPILSGLVHVNASFTLTIFYFFLVAWESLIKII